MACVRECPGSAISATKTVKVELAGNLVEWGELDCDACDLAFRGGMKGDGEYIEGWREGTVPSSISPFYKKPRNLYNTGQAVCGGRGCVRACMINLEKRGVLENKFEKPFRRRKPWLVDWSQPDETASSNEAGNKLKLINKKRPSGLFTIQMKLLMEAAFLVSANILRKILFHRTTSILYIRLNTLPAHDGEGILR